MSKLKEKKPKLGVAKAPKKVKKPVYHLEVNVNDVDYKGKADSLEQALKDFVDSPDFPFSVKTRVFMKFGKGKDMQERTYPVFVARRLFNRISFRDSALEILANKLETYS